MAKILVVDDEAIALRYVSRLLKVQGHTVVGNEDGRAALERLKEESDIELILADVMMPWVNGLKLAAAVRAWPERCHIPVILMSGIVGPGFISDAMEEGVCAFLEKPISTQKLIEYTEKFLAPSKNGTCPE